MHLEVDHVPEAVQVASGNLLLAGAIFTLLHQTCKLLESLGHQQLGLPYCRPDAAVNCNQIRCTNN